jgi:hypothetical protein
MTRPLQHDEREWLRCEVARCWPLAQAYWSRFLLLGQPADDSSQPSIAQIDLGTRQVSLNADEILSRGLVGSVEALLAHEVGHHVRFPGTLQTQARLRILERSLIPFDDYSIINLFTDLMINERLGCVVGDTPSNPRHSLRDQMVRIYLAFTTEPAFHGEGRWKHDPLFLFYLAIYEELWRLDAGALIGPAAGEFGRAFPGYRAEAAVLAQNVFTLGPNLYTQFLYFLSIATRYLRPLVAARLIAIDPYQCGAGQPTADDWGEAITPTARELEAIRRAIDEGWFAEDQGKRLSESADAETRMAGLPGFGTADATQVPEAMAAYYRQQAVAHLLRPPAQRRWGEANTPTTLEEWEPGDSLRDIDWLATLTLRGEELGTALPLKRARAAEHEGYDVPMWQPRMEVYLDVSGSMPNPCFAFNAMTLAAQILSLGTVRAGGRVRALLFSSEPHLFWEWSRSEVEMSRFLMHYLGAGTVFPFGILASSVAECGDDQPIRVVISDRDFDANVSAEPSHRLTLADAVAKSARFVLLQHRPDPTAVRSYRGLGATVIEVHEMKDFPRVATELAQALFPEELHVL